MLKKLQYLFLYTLLGLQSCAGAVKENLTFCAFLPDINQSTDEQEAKQNRKFICTTREGIVQFYKNHGGDLSFRVLATQELRKPAKVGTIPDKLDFYKELGLRKQFSEKTKHRNYSILISGDYYNELKAAFEKYITQQALDKKTQDELAKRSAYQQKVNQNLNVPKGLGKKNNKRPTLNVVSETTKEIMNFYRRSRRRKRVSKNRYSQPSADQEDKSLATAVSIVSLLVFNYVITKFLSSFLSLSDDGSYLRPTSEA